MKSNEMKKEKAEINPEEIEQFIIDAGSDDLPTFGGSFEGGIYCQQIPDEIVPCILAILESGQPVKSYLEIGVAAGGTTFLVNHFFKPEKIILIDDNMHPKCSLRAEVLKDISYIEIIGNSQAEEIVGQIISAGILFDAILIDGDHSYAGVKLDIVLYLPFLRIGGFLILHDSVRPEFGVARVVKELKADLKMEFIGEWASKNHPIPCGVALFRKV
ncbi:MAG: class I SAM-dependent methyltransferase, partial [Pseudomonadota bacterium]